jgi:hypothetical protein
MKPKGWQLRMERTMLPATCERSDDGLREFIEFENGGADPVAPYGKFLLDGKRWLEWTINEYAALYGTFEWPGWGQLEIDFAEDPKMLRMIRQRIGVA